MSENEQIAKHDSETETFQTADNQTGHSKSKITHVSHITIATSSILGTVGGLCLGIGTYIANLLLIILGIIFSIAGGLVYLLAAKNAEDNELLSLTSNKPVKYPTIDEITSALKPRSEPNIGIEREFFTFKPNRSPRQILHLLNNGTDTAYDYRARACYEWQPVGFKGRVTNRANTCIESLPDIPKNTKFSLTIEWDTAIDAATVNDIKSGNLLFFLYIEGDYKDSVDDLYPFRYCWMYAPAVGGLTIAPKHFWPKQDE